MARRVAVAAVVAACLVAGADTAWAGGTYVWTNVAAGRFHWNNPGGTNQWNVPGSFPNAAGDEAVITNAIAQAQTNYLNQSITIGKLTIGAKSGARPFFIVPGTAGSLTFDTNGVNAQIVKNAVAATTNDWITANITLNSSLDIDMGAVGTAGYGLVITGAITEAGGGEDRHETRQRQWRPHAQRVQ